MQTPVDLLSSDEVMSYGGRVDRPTALGAPGLEPRSWMPPASPGRVAHRLQGLALCPGGRRQGALPAAAALPAMARPPRGLESN